MKGCMICDWCIVLSEITISVKSNSSANGSLTLSLSKIKLMFVVSSIS